jgi:hypothetical protein
MHRFMTAERTLLRIEIVLSLGAGNEDLHVQVRGLLVVRDRRLDHKRHNHAGIAVVRRRVQIEECPGLGREGVQLDTAFNKGKETL